MNDIVYVLDDTKYYTVLSNLYEHVVYTHELERTIRDVSPLYIICIPGYHIDSIHRMDKLAYEISSKYFIITGRLLTYYNAKTANDLFLRGFDFFVKSCVSTKSKVYNCSINIDDYDINQIITIFSNKKILYKYYIENILHIEIDRIKHNKWDIRKICISRDPFQIKGV